MSKIDFTKDKGYYRDIIKNYSSATLSYIDDFKINSFKEIATTILTLQLKKKVKIDKKIIILNKETDDLTNIEKYILDNIKDGKIKIPTLNSINFYIKNEALKEKLIEKNISVYQKTSKIKKALILNSLIQFSAILSVVIMKKSNSSYIIFGIGTIIFWIVLIYLISYAVILSTTFQRTSKGNEINIKLERLKNFIKSFGILEEKSQNDLIIWEEYLIYSVMFNINKAVINEMKNLIEVKF